MTITEHPVDRPSAVSPTIVPPPAGPPATRPGTLSRDAPPDQPDEPGRMLHRRWRPAPTRAGWITAGIGLLAAVLYLWGLSRVGYANSYYTAAVKSATKSWKAFFFGSIDPGNFITVDKPPAAIWFQALSARALGFSSFSMLLPDALAGVGSVLLLHNLVRRWAGNTAAHLSALALAVTPVAVLMFRFNNPDAILTFLCLAATWALWRAVESGRTRWLVLSGALVGLAFETKMLQAGLIIPALIVTYLVAGPPRIGRRLAQLSAALLAVVVSSSWWVAIVALWPAATRPYIGSTTDNSIVSLVLGYNGLSRLFGNGGPGGATGGGGGGAMFGGTPGVFRLGDSVLGGQISWLIPLAASGLAAGLWVSRRGPRTSRFRAGWLLWGTWALVCMAVFSLSKGVFHPYYTVQLAPALAALAGTGSLALWKIGRQHRALSWVLPAAVVASAAWAVVLLHRTPTFAAWLPPLIIGGAALAAAGLWFGTHLRHRMLLLVAGGVAAACLLAGPTAYSLTTIAHPTSGSLASAGPSSASSGLPGGGRGGSGGPGQAGTTDAALVSYLESHQGTATYLVAAFGSQSSAPIIIASGKPVMTIGGFNGSDPAPTLAQFQKLVAAGKVRYVLLGNGSMGGGAGGGGGPGNSTTSAISAWVTAHGKTVTVPGSSSTLYDLAGSAS